MSVAWTESRLFLERRRKGQVGSRVWRALVLSMTAASMGSCKGPVNVAGGRDAAVPQDLQPEARDTLVSSDLATRPDSRQAGEDAPPTGCTSKTVEANDNPVHGSIRGPRVDGVVCDNGLGTTFLGPGGAAFSPYAQSFNSTFDSNGFLAHDFLFDMPAGVFSASLSGWTGTTSPDVGTYTSTTNCGWLTFEVSLPIPPGVICPPLGQSCGPDCEGTGELSICQPAHPKLRYSALPAAKCGSSQDPPKGDWQVTLTSISPDVRPSTFINFVTHGTLTATLVNGDDPSDSVVLNLDF
jgi:hypothetical protein